MKKKLSYFILFCIMSAYFLSVSAQEAITQTTYPDDIIKTIIKEYSFPATVSYVETKEHHYFAFADQTMIVINCEIDHDIFVRDFTILDDNVFFCGIRDGKTSNGLWGCFKISDLQNGNLSYETYENFDCGKHIVDTLHRIVAYVENGTKHIVTVGTTNDGTTTNGCTIDIMPNNNGSSAWMYTIGVTPDYSVERINRICVTDNYVVTSGPATNPADIEVYRIHNKSNLFAPGGLQDNVWMFVISVYFSYNHNTENYEITHIRDDIVGMAIQTNDLYYYPNNYFGILVMAYDMTTLANGTFTTLYQHYLPTINKLNINGFKFKQGNDNMIVLLDGNTPFGMGSVITEIPLLSNSITTKFLAGHKLTSYDFYNNYFNNLCQGLDLSQPNLSTYYTQPIGIVSTCAINNYYTTSQPNFMTKWDYWPYKICLKDFDCNYYYQINSIYTPNDITCFSNRIDRD